MIHSSHLYLYKRRASFRKGSNRLGRMFLTDIRDTWRQQLMQECYHRRLSTILVNQRSITLKPILFPIPLALNPSFNLLYSIHCILYNKAKYCRSDQSCYVRRTFGQAAEFVYGGCRLSLQIRPVLKLLVMLCLMRTSAKVTCEAWTVLTGIIYICKNIFVNNLHYLCTIFPQLLVPIK